MGVLNVTVDDLKSIINTQKHYIDEARLARILESEYNRQAVAFLIKTKTMCDIEYTGSSSPEWDKNNKHDTYLVTLKNAKHTYTFPFWDSLRSTQNRAKGKGKLLTFDFYSVLAGLGYEVSSNFDEWSSDMGIESFKTEREYLKLKIQHLACVDEFNSLKKLFNSEELAELQEIQ